MGEILRKAEVQFSSVTGISVVAKGIGSLCILGPLLVDSGVDQVLEHLKIIPANPNKSDYNIVLSGGDLIDFPYSNIVRVVRASWKEPFITAIKDGILFMSLFTFATDHVGRETEITIAVSGVSQIGADQEACWNLFQSLFPGITFQEFTKNEFKKFVGGFGGAFQALKNLADKKTIPYLLPEESVSEVK